MAPINDVAPLLEERLTMDVHHTREAVVLTLEGELDLATTPMLKTALALLHAGGACPLVVLDLAGVGFMDGAGLRCITRAARRLSDRGVALAVTHPSRPVRRLLELCDPGGLLRWDGSNPGRLRAAPQETRLAAQGAGWERQGTWTPAA